MLSATQELLILLAGAYETIQMDLRHMTVSYAVVRQDSGEDLAAPVSRFLIPTWGVSAKQAEVFAAAYNTACTLLTDIIGNIYFLKSCPKSLPDTFLVPSFLAIRLQKHLDTNKKRWIMAKNKSVKTKLAHVVVKMPMAVQNKVKMMNMSGGVFLNSIAVDASLIAAIESLPREQVRRA